MLHNQYTINNFALDSIATFRQQSSLLASKMVNAGQMRKNFLYGGKKFIFDHVSECERDDSYSYYFTDETNETLYRVSNHWSHNEPLTEGAKSIDDITFCGQIGQCWWSIATDSLDTFSQHIHGKQVNFLCGTVTFNDMNRHTKLAYYQAREKKLNLAKERLEAKEYICKVRNILIKRDLHTANNPKACLDVMSEVADSLGKPIRSLLYPYCLITQSDYLSFPEMGIFNDDFLLFFNNYITHLNSLCQRNRDLFTTLLSQRNLDSSVLSLDSNSPVIALNDSLIIDVQQITLKSLSIEPKDRQKSLKCLMRTNTPFILSYSYLYEWQQRFEKNSSFSDLSIRPLYTLSHYDHYLATRFRIHIPARSDQVMVTADDIQSISSNIKNLLKSELNCSARHFANEAIGLLQPLEKRIESLIVNK
ncbi:hypothetical protein [Photobacterium leiognathi]|uniref:hypothetical protein n=1 Tax=Photobacterium leiognathi TaxID=553611 RepID=UPI002981210E|nr:hypothetical protein [Photobacterium leiognathi]